MIDNMSSGNLGFFAMITEKRKLRIFWLDQNEEEDVYHQIDVD